MFIRSLKSSGELTNLISLLREDKNLVNDVVFRIARLVKRNFDFRYENPFDVAIASYAWALSETYPTIDKMIASQITNTKQIWWTREIAKYIFAKQTTVEVVHSQYIKVPSKEDFARVIARSQLDAVVKNISFGGLLPDMTDYVVDIEPPNIDQVQRISELPVEWPGRADMFSVKVDLGSNVPSSDARWVH